MLLRTDPILDKATFALDALQLKWEIASTYDEHLSRSSNVYIVAKDTEIITVVMKDIPFNLAQHLIELHNKSIEEHNED